MQGVALIEALDTDITALEVDAIANAANTRLQHGGGVAGRDPARRRPGDPAGVRRERADRARRGRRDLRRRHALPLGHPRRHDGARRPDLGARSSATRPPRRSPRPTSSARAAWRSWRSAPASAASRSREAAEIEVEEVRRHLEGGSPLERVVFAVHGEAALQAFQAALASDGRRVRRAGGRGRRCGRHAPLRPPAPRGCARCSRRRCATAPPSSASRAPATATRSWSRSRSTTASLLAATPARAGLRADPEAAGDREWLLVAAAVGALVELAEPGPPAAANDLALKAGPVAGGVSLLGLPGARSSRRPTSTSSSRSPSRTTRAGSTGCARRRWRSPAPCSPTRPRAARADRRRAPAARRRGRGAARRPRRGPRVGGGARRRRRGAARAARLRRRPPARGPGPGPPRRPADPPAPRRHGQVGRLPHRLRAPARAASRATSARSPRTSARRCCAPGCSRRSPRSASATST